MLTGRVSSLKCLQEHTDDVLYCSGDPIRGWFFVQEHFEGGHLY